jgi:hypothetical protein
MMGRQARASVRVMRLWKPHDLGRSCLCFTIRHDVTNETEPQNAGALATYQVDADLASSAKQSTAQRPCRAAHLHPSGVAAGHEPLTMDRRPSAVLAAVSAGRMAP